MMWLRLAIQLALVMGAAECQVVTTALSAPASAVLFDAATGTLLVGDATHLRRLAPDTLDQLSAIRQSDPDPCVATA
jgi:hypothetical protein